MVNDDLRGRLEAIADGHGYVREDYWR